MMQAFRIYHLFFPRKWVVWLLYTGYILLPVGTSAIGKWVWINSPETRGVMSLMMVSASMVGVEYLLDFFMLTGIAAKDNRSLEYMKSSSKGVDLMRKTFALDGIRRVLTSVAALLLLYVLEGRILSVWCYVECALVVVLLVEVGFALTRRCKAPAFTFVLLYLASTFACPLTIGLAECPSFWLTTGLLIAMILVMVVNRKVWIKKVRESYYDTGCKEMF